MTSRRPQRIGTLLTVGATGMLLPALTDLFSAADETLVVARRASLTVERFSPAGRVIPLDLDWKEPEPAIAALEPHLDAVDVALIWIHSRGTGFWHALMQRLAVRPRLVVQVLGSSADPETLRERVAALSPVPGFRYRTVSLGSVVENGTRRWLTHEEISEGALEAIREERDVFVGGPPSSEDGYGLR